MDRVGADFDRVVAQMGSRLHARALVTQLPWGAEDQFHGVIDLVKNAAIHYEDDRLGADFELRPIPAEFAEEVARRREELVAALGGHVLALRDGPDAAARYHGAATLLAGGTVALFAAAERLLEGLAPDEDVTRAFHALLASAVSNLAELPPAEALTGPVARGEVVVVEEHLAALDRTSPEAAAAYRALGKVMLGLRDPGAGAGPEALARLGRLFDEA